MARVAHAPRIDSPGLGGDWRHRPPNTPSIRGPRNSPSSRTLPRTGRAPLAMSKRHGSPSLRDPHRPLSSLMDRTYRPVRIPAVTPVDSAENGA